MGFRLYAGRKVWLLVPGCMHPPKVAFDLHGPLSFLLEFEDTALHAPEREDVERVIIADLYATIPEELARRLVRSLEPS